MMIRDLNTDALLGRLGLERRRSFLSRSAPLIAAAGAGVLAGIGLMAAARTRRGQAVQEDLSLRLSQVADDLSRVASDVGARMKTTKGGDGAHARA